MRAVIVGAGGQDGQLLTIHLERQGYQVVGITRQQTTAPGLPKAESPIDVLDPAAITSAIAKICPDEIYYLAAFHQSSQAEPMPEGELFRKSLEVNVNGYVNVLEAVRTRSPQARVFYAGSSHIFRGTTTTIQDESTPVAPICAYGTSKAAGIFAGHVYRQRYGIFAACGILYNHESALRSNTFLSKKIITAALAIRNGAKESLIVGDLNAEVDWGYAPDFVDAFQRILALREAEDFVVATGVMHTVRDFVAEAFSQLDLDWQPYVEERPGLVTKPTRPLVGDSSKLRAATGWAPSVNFSRMVANLLRDSAA